MLIHLITCTLTITIILKYATLLTNSYGSIIHTIFILCVVPWHAGYGGEVAAPGSRDNDSQSSRRDKGVGGCV